MEISKKYDDVTLQKLQSVLKMMLSDFIVICEKYDIKYFADYGTALGALRHGGFIPWDDDIDVGMLRSDFEKFCEVLPKEMGDKYFITAPGIGTYYNMDTKLNLRGTYFALPRAPEGFKPCIFMDIFVWENCPADQSAAKKMFKKIHRIENYKYLRDINLDRKEKTVAGGASAATQTKYKLLKIVQKAVNVFVRSDDKFNKMYFNVINKYKGKSDLYFAPMSNMLFINNISEIYPLREIQFDGMKIKIKHNCEDTLKFCYGDYMKLPPEEEQWNHMVETIDFGVYDA